MSHDDIPRKRSTSAVVSAVAAIMPDCRMRPAISGRDVSPLNGPSSRDAKCLATPAIVGRIDAGSR